MFEHRSEPLAPHHRFVSRLTRASLAAAGIVAAMLVVGMVGYGALEGMSGVDAFVNAAMILSGMGPVQPLTTAAGKVFAGVYALASGLVVVAATGLVLAPVLHRLLHAFHADQRDGN